MTKHYIKNKSGQAMIEFCIGLVAFLALFAGILEITKLARTQRATMIEARMEAAEIAFLDFKSTESPNYISDWNANPEPSGDGNRHTADDYYQGGNIAAINSYILDKAALNTPVAVEPGEENPFGISALTDWEILNTVPNKDYPSEISSLHNALGGHTDFGIISGNSYSNIHLSSAVQHLIYGKESIAIESEVWVTWTKGIY